MAGWEPQSLTHECAQMASSEQFCYKESIYERAWAEKVLPFLEVFRQVFGHCIVHQCFVVPLAAPWPEKAWEMHLGCVVKHLRRRRTMSSL
jgi:hypothetical protein